MQNRKNKKIEEIKYNSNIRINPFDNIDIFINYNCTDLEKCKIQEIDKDTLGYRLIVNYDSYILKHENEIPLEKSKVKLYHFFNPEYPSYSIAEWYNVIYKEEKDVLGRWNDKLNGINSLINGYYKISDSSFFKRDDPYFIKKFNPKGEPYLPLAYLLLEPNKEKYAL